MRRSADATRVLILALKRRNNRATLKEEKFMANGRVRARVKRERYVKTFAELSHANWVLLENVEQQPSGWFYECMAAILTSAFKFEAYLNHVGEATFPYWAEMERLPHKAKLNIIRKHFGLASRDGCRPYQTLTDLFRFRDALAHGKSEYLDPPETIEIGHAEELRRKKPLAQWEELCTMDFAKRAYEDTEEIIRQIQESAGLDISDLFCGGHSYKLSDMREIDTE
jgi:hypothetical protein